MQCDLRAFNMEVLGKFAVVMADPPWDIHMELPYGTLSDDEMKNLNVPSLQDHGFIFLWVTGRFCAVAIELFEYHLSISNNLMYIQTVYVSMQGHRTRTRLHPKVGVCSLNVFLVH